MSKVKIAQKGPYIYEVEKGKTYYWCTCGYSKTQPLCDGSHRKTDTGLKSFPFTPDKNMTVYLCGCKHTGSKPFCDGSHQGL